MSDEKAKGVEMLAQWLAARHRHRASEVELIEASVAMARGLRRFADKISPPPVGSICEGSFRQPWRCSAVDRGPRAEIDDAASNTSQTGNVVQMRPRGAQ